MEWNRYNKNFSLNDYSFKNIDDLIIYSKTISEDISIFLQEWFNSNDYIKVNTSGSTGTPKEIFLKKSHVINSAKATGKFFNLQKGTNALLCLPIKYIAGKLMIIRALTLGWKLDYVSPSSKPLSNISKIYDFSAMTPMQLENSISNIFKIKKLIVGGGAISSALEEKLQNVETRMFSTYGMTETITHIAVKPINHHTIYPNYYEVLPNVKIYTDERNCLVINAQKISNDIIFTNDVVDLISPKKFNWLGRFDNIINSGGVKLQPEIIEQKLSSLISNRFFVYGKPDNYLGEKLILIIEGDDYKVDFEISSLTKLEIPKEVYFIKKFVETQSGKTHRKNTVMKTLNK